MEASLDKQVVKQVLIANGGKMANKALVKHFKKLLSGTNSENRSKFKDIINEIATVSKDAKGRSIITLKEEDGDGSLDQENRQPEKADSTVSESTTASKDSGETSKSTEELNGATAASTSVDTTDTPLAEVNLSMDTDAEVSAENVRERARRFDAMEEQAQQEREESPSKLLRQATDENACVCASANAEEDNTISLDEVKRKWMIMAAKCDYQAMARFLKDHHHLAGWKNFCNGYTALHYAAKFGELDCIKLLAGSHKANVNAINHAGMTPLHLSAMHNRGAAIQLLVQTYKSDPNIRDYRGKLPKDYLNDQATRRMSLLMTTQTIGHSDGPNILEMGYLLSEDEMLSVSARQYLEGLNRNSTMRGDGTMTGEGYGGTLRAGDAFTQASLLRRSFRVGTSKPQNLPDQRFLSETVGAVQGLRKGSYGGAMSLQKSNAPVTRTMSPPRISMPKSRSVAKRQLKQQKRIASMVEEVPEDEME